MENATTGAPGAVCYDADSVKVKVLFFGLLKDITGHQEEWFEAPEGSTLQGVFDAYAARHPRLAELSSSIVLAANQQFGARSRVLFDGDEVAFLPPVSGGADRYFLRIDRPGGHFSALTREVIETRAIADAILRPEDGAVVHFEGVVRNNTKGRKTRYLEYEAYESMAVDTMARIGDEIAQQFEIGRIAMVHRLGRLEIGEASVAVVVSSPHRKAAFDAALEGINRLKRFVPVWKKEFFEDGEVWVEGDWDTSVTQR